jgi:hypothetical protein
MLLVPRALLSTQSLRRSEAREGGGSACLARRAAAAGASGGVGRAPAADTRYTRVHTCMHALHSSKHVYRPTLFYFSEMRITSSSFATHACMHACINDDMKLSGNTDSAHRDMPTDVLALHISILAFSSRSEKAWLYCTVLYV